MINSTSRDNFAAIGSARRVIEIGESLTQIASSGNNQKELFKRSLTALDIALASVCHDLWSPATWHGFRVRAEAIRAGVFSVPTSTLQGHLAAIEGLLAQHGPPSATEPQSLLSAIVAGSVVRVLPADRATDPALTFITVSGDARWCAHLHPTASDAEPCAQTWWHAGVAHLRHGPPAKVTTLAQISL